MRTKLKITDKETGAWAYSYEARDKYLAQAFMPKGKRHVFFYSYRTQAQRDKRLQDFFASAREHKIIIAQRRVERSQPCRLELGTVMTGSWGYDQTNVEAWQVVKIVGKNTVQLRAVKCTQLDSASGHSMSCYLIPCPNEFSGAEIVTRRVQYGHNVLINRHCSLSPWKGDKLYCSWYA